MFACFLTFFKFLSWVLAKQGFYSFSAFPKNRPLWPKFSHFFKLKLSKSSIKHQKCQADSWKFLEIFSLVTVKARSSSCQKKNSYEHWPRAVATFISFQSPGSGSSLHYGSLVGLCSLLFERLVFCLRPSGRKGRRNPSQHDVCRVSWVLGPYDAAPSGNLT